MWRLLAIAVILLPATVMATQGVGITLRGDAFLSRSVAGLVKATEATPRLHPDHVPPAGGQLLALAAANGSAPDKESKKAASVKEDDIDLRHVAVQVGDNLLESRWGRFGGGDASPPLRQDGAEPPQARPEQILRYVDWDKIKAGKSGKEGNGVSEQANGGGDEEEEDKDEKEGGEKEDEGGGGWDRPWDAPKLG